MKKIPLFLLSTIALTACSSQPTQIVQTGADRYEITKKVPNYPGEGVLQNDVKKEAKNFCGSLKKRLHILSINETKPPFSDSRLPQAEIKFKCSPKH